jgi:VanZ family protein
MTRQATLIHRVTLLASAGFLAFILWLIYMADTGTGASNILFKMSDRLAYGDKIGHLLLFGPLTLGVNASLKFKKIQLGGRGNIYLGTLLVACFVLTEELSQYFLPTRTVEALDLLADSVGITFFTWLSFWIDRRQNQS